MKFWKNNRVDQEVDMPIEEVALLFAASRWVFEPWPLDRRLRAFLTDPTGPINAVWVDNDAYEQLLNLVHDTETKLRNGEGESDNK